MKVFKQKQHSFFPRPLFIGGKLYLSMGVMALFDLTAPDTLLTEQELWKTLPAQLGPKPVIDQGVPKPRGEYLVTGSCFAPRGEARPASRVRIRVGELQKSVNIYGDRYWKNGSITSAEPFTEMPLVWANGYGGEGFKRNPLGKGIHKVPMPDGSTCVPLPNLELPDQQIGAPEDAPSPAGLGPIDIMWPQRFDKNGTYDEKWKAGRWPHFPDDMNYEFFNMACEDQFLDGYFQGGEPVRIENMHPDMPVIESSLPDLRMRMFATLNPNFKPHAFPVGPLPSHQLGEDDEFREVQARLETVWFFPSILRGLVIYRGLTEIRDEEYGDVLRIFIRHESTADEPRPIEYYRDRQVELLDRGVDMDMSKANEAIAAAEAAKIKIRNIPKFADKIRQKALGNRPVMPMPEPEEMLARSRTMLAEHAKRLDDLEAMARKLHARHGHLVEINLGVFDSFRHTIAEMGQQIETTATKLSTTQKEIEAERVKVVKKTAAGLGKIPPGLRDKAGLDIDKLLSENPLQILISPWHDRGFPFVVRCRKALENAPETRRQLKGLGFTRETILDSWMGVNLDKMDEQSSDWGMDTPEHFVLQAGLVLPRFNGQELKRIQCHETPFDSGRQTTVPGSDTTPRFLPAATLIDLPSMPAAAGAPIICVPDELQALFLEQEVGDCCSVIAMPSPADKQGEDGAEAIKNGQAFLVVLPHGWERDMEQAAAWETWQETFAGAVPMELEHGMTVFQARSRGSDIRNWVFRHLPPDYAEIHSVALGRLQNGRPPGKDFLKDFKLEFPDIRGLITGIHAEVKQAMEAEFAPMLAKKDELLARARKRATEHGIPLDLDAPPKAPEESIPDMGRRLAAKMRKRALEQERAGYIGKDLRAQMESEAARLEAQCEGAEALETSLTQQFDARKKELKEGLKKLEAMEPPEKVREKLKQHGIDADNIRPMTREQVRQAHEQGKNIAGAILSGVDLSGLDLTGADLSGCRLKGTDFTGTVLNEVRLDKAMGKGAIFSKASLRGACLSGAMLTDADFTEADLSGAGADKAVLKGSDFTKATLTDAVFDMAILEKTNFTEADLSGARINMCMVSGKADRGIFQKAHITKALFKENSLDNVNFREATISQSLFNGAKGKGGNFSGANLDKLRTGRNAEFTDADFTRATLRQAGLRETDFSGSDFREADLEGALIDNSTMKETNFNRARARNAKFTKSNFEGANMRALDMLTGSLRKSRLVNADLRGSNLFAVDFYKAVLGDTRFEGANLKRSHLENRLDLLDDDQ